MGSLREESYALKIAKNTLEMFSDDFEPEIVSIRDLPLYDADYDDATMTHKPLPQAYSVFRQTLKEAAGILFVASENNRTISACLKNALDVASKPKGDVALMNTPVAVISHSVGAMGGYSANKNLRPALSYFVMPTAQQPEVFLGHSPELLDDQGHFKAESTQQFVQSYIQQFEALMVAHPKA